MSIRQREKASDVFRKTNFVFAEKVSFEKAFPEIEDIKIECEETGHTGYYRDKPIRRLYDINHLPGEYIDCSNPLCYNGGFSIGSVLREMVRDRKTKLEGNALCQGYEGSPKGRRKYRKCVNFFRYKIWIKYKKSSSS